MPKPIIKHQTQDGVVHTRRTARTYTHVIVATYPEGIPHALAEYPPGYSCVWSWVGRPDLVTGALSEARKRADRREDCPVRVVAESINGGTRWAAGEDSADRAEAAHAGGFQD